MCFGQLCHQTPSADKEVSSSVWRGESMKQNHLLNAFCFPKAAAVLFVGCLKERFLQGFPPARRFPLQGVSSSSGRCLCFRETRRFLQRGRSSFRLCPSPCCFLPEAVSYGVAFTPRLVLTAHDGCSLGREPQCGQELFGNREAVLIVHKAKKHALTRFGSVAVAAKPALLL